MISEPLLRRTTRYLLNGNDTWKRYGLLEDLGGKDYRKKSVGLCGQRKIPPRSMTINWTKMKKVGFPKVEILHKNMCLGLLEVLK